MSPWNLNLNGSKLWDSRYMLLTTYPINLKKNAFRWNIMINILLQEFHVDLFDFE